MCFNCVLIVCLWTRTCVYVHVFCVSACVHMCTCCVCVHIWCVCVYVGQGTWIRMPGSFQIIGLDFLVTSNFEIKFLEANNYPLWSMPSTEIEPMLQWMTVSEYECVHAVCAYTYMCVSES